MKLTVQVCMGLAVIVPSSSESRFSGGCPWAFWGLLPGGYIQGAQALALLGIGFYCLGRLDQRQG